MLLALVLLLSSSAGTGQDTCSIAPSIADIPKPVYDGRGVPAPRTPLMRTHDLVRSFTEGEGVLRAGPRPAPDAGSGLAYTMPALPWDVSPGRRDASRLVTWRGRMKHVDSEGMIGFVLRAGDSWCSPPVEAAAGSRLRFEPVALDEGSAARLRVRWDAADPALADRPVAAPRILDAQAQWDVGLEPRRGALCFEAAGGTVAVGEARLLAPEPAGSDARPRWLVLTMVDALRGDVLEGPHAERNAPTLRALARRGRVYGNAVSGGCHTQAGIWPVLTGRDLMRFDPLRRRSFVWARQPYQTFETVFSRPNLFVSQLAQEMGYHAVFLGNNAFLDGAPAFARYSITGRGDTGTIDTVARLPALFARYADERVMLLYYVSSPHNSSFTPRRLYEEFGCAQESGVDECRCRYGARVRHADESLAAFQEGLAQAGLAGTTLQMITADHGEAFGDTVTLESDISGEWKRIDEFHGFTCQWSEVHVPLLAIGPGIAPATSSRPVSSLDIAPTLSGVMGLPPISRMDGEPLPFFAPDSARTADRSLVSYGYCSHAVSEKGRQLIWWQGDCGSRRPLGGGPVMSYASELWEGGRRVATDQSDPARLRGPMASHARWLSERLPAEAMVFDARDLPPSTLKVTAITGRIVDYGPSRTVHGLTGIRRATLAKDGRTLEVELDGYRGLYTVATFPAITPLRIELAPKDGGVAPLGALGPLQLPVDFLGRTLDPGTHPRWLFSAEEPPRRALARPQLRVWWRPWSTTRSETETGVALLDFGRVLREWGYIR